MSREKAVSLECDGCGYTRYSIHSTFNMAEIKAKKKGWEIKGSGPDKKHYCRKCSESDLENE
jgi:hypothetical protein